MNYKHFNIIERSKIEQLSNMGYSTREIAKILYRHHSSIARELKRSTNSLPGKYDAAEAHNDYKCNKSRCGRKNKLTQDMRDIIVDRLNATWSPEQIAHTVMKNKYSTKSIYNAIYSKAITFDVKKLRQKGKRR